MKKRTFTDKQRLDWLEQQIVEVRDYLQFGSRELFTEYPNAEADSPNPSQLRLRIDRQMRKKR